MADRDLLFYRITVLVAIAWVNTRLCSAKMTVALHANDSFFDGKKEFSDGLQEFRTNRKSALNP